MKKLIGLMLCFSCAVLSACSNDFILEKGTETEYASPLKGTFGEQLEKRAVRMINVEGELYYDSGLVSENTPRCGTLDGQLEKTVSDNEIPRNSGEANFEAEGYQHATTITKEVNVDGQWLIFKKYNTYGSSLEGLQYCFYMKGHLNNAVKDSEIIVLCGEETVTFNDVYEPLLSSAYKPGANLSRMIHNPIFSDKWGITLFYDNVTPTGLTLQIEQFGGNPAGELQTGAWYSLETTVDDQWQELKTKTGEPLVWNSIAYMVKKNDITEMKIDWQYGYGKLEPGFYRLSKKVMDFRAAGDFSEAVYSVYFTIE